MKTFGVSLDSIALIIRDGDTITTETFKTRRQADKRILELMGSGYKFDSTHETLKPSAS